MIASEKLRGLRSSLQCMKSAAALNMTGVPTRESTLRLPADVACHELLRHCVAYVMCQHMHSRHVQVLQKTLHHISISINAVWSRVQSSGLVAKSKACTSALHHQSETENQCCLRHVSAHAQPSRPDAPADFPPYQPMWRCCMG